MKPQEDWGFAARMTLTKEPACGLCHHPHDIFKYLPVLTCITELGFSLDFYSDTVPVDGAPSYKGHAVKYSYKITVGTSRVQGDSKLLRLPIRILVVQGKQTRSVESYSTVVRTQKPNCLKPVTYSSTFVDQQFEFTIHISTSRTAGPVF